MPSLNYDYWPCPFCGKGSIEVMIKPSTFSAKRTACRAGRSTKMTRTREESFIVSEKCPACGKTDVDIEKKWREEGLI